MPTHSTPENNYIEMGDLFTQQQQWEQALNCYQQAIKSNLNSLKVITNLLGF
jgi:tetratricopeptide (TPR) repeat protein